MSNIKKLSAFRQLSLHCDTPNPEQRKKPLRKQFSEDVPDAAREWSQAGMGIKVSLNRKIGGNLMNHLPIKIAWEENEAEVKTDEAVIIKKCKEIRRTSFGKLFRQGSLEKDSILHSKQDLADRLNPVAKDKEPEKPNLKIFLAHNSTDQAEDIYNNLDRGTRQYSEQPKLIPSLISNNVSNEKHKFQIRRKVRPKINLNEIAYSPTRSSSSSSATFERNAVVVVPIVENYEEKTNIADPLSDKDNVKAIDSVIIRPSTTATRRESFQKRSNSAFNATIKEVSNPRPVLMRSSSAPSKPDHGKSKFVVSKRKIKPAKKLLMKIQSIDDNAMDKSDKENPKSQKELNRTTAINGNDVVTMVSLVSPTGSDCEEVAVDESANEKTKNANKNSKQSAKDEKDVTKMMSMRKAVKSVSFQQSSIHAIRSFSASFPARRASMATALMLGDNPPKTTAHLNKMQEKRSTNSTTPDVDERVPKRRLVRSDDEESKTASSEAPENTEEQPAFGGKGTPAENDSARFDVVIKSKSIEDLAANTEQQPKAIVKEENAPEKEKDAKENSQYESTKEKQCWNMYCKMTEKGINVSFDTILRGILTPTEYRMSRKNSVAGSTNC